MSGVAPSIVSGNVVTVEVAAANVPRSLTSGVTDAPPSGNDTLTVRPSAGTGATLFTVMLRVPVSPGWSSAGSTDRVSDRSAWSSVTLTSSMYQSSAAAPWYRHARYTTFPT